MGSDSVLAGAEVPQISSQFGSGARAIPQRLSLFTKAARAFGRLTLEPLKFTESLLFGKLDEFRRMRVYRGNCGTFYFTARGRWQPGCHSRHFAGSCATACDRYGQDPGPCDARWEHGGADTR